MKIVNRYTKHSGLIETGSGYGDVARVSKKELLALLYAIPGDDIKITSAPHKDGRVVLVRETGGDSKLWHALAPTTKRRKDE
jgi:hypothetical protein